MCRAYISFSADTLVLVLVLTSYLVVAYVNFALGGPMASPIPKQPSEQDQEIKQQIKQDPDVEMIKKRLFNLAMQGKWGDVIKTYQDEPAAHRAKITRSGDTALHLAVLDRKESVVEKLVKLINVEVERVEAGKVEAEKEGSSSSREGEGAKAENTEHPLEIANDRGNTPLHLAASIGNVRMCLRIARERKELVNARNKERETPLFLAAFHGKKAAFLCLHDLCDPTTRSDNSRRGDGETILHCAISGEYFDLAYQIAHTYKCILNFVNEQGHTPLHILASKPTAFESGSHLGWFNKIVYYCLYVEKLKKESFPHYDVEDKVEDKWEPEKYPENCTTCVNFFQLLTVLWNVLKKSVISAPRKENPRTSEKNDTENPKNEQFDASQKQGKKSSNEVDEQHQLLPPNYYICFEFIQFMYKAMLVVLGFGSKMKQKIQAKKEKNIWSIQIMDKLLESLSNEYCDSSAGSRPTELGETDVFRAIDQVENTPEAGPPTKTGSGKTDEEMKIDELAKKKMDEMAKKETPILIAAKNGIVEMVGRILDLFPVAIHDMNSEKKNIVLVAVESRQPHVYGFLLKREILKESIFHVVDSEGNSALHLAAQSNNSHPWRIPGAALQMQWEIKWYQYVKNSMPMHFFVRHNKENKTAREIFTESHRGLVEKGGEWLNNTSNSCSVVAALIATVAFTTSATIPGGVEAESGRPTLEKQPAFNVFSISSLIALCFSVTSVVMFLAILTSRHQEKDFGRDLPRKLLCGLSSLFISIAAILVSFCAGHFFVLKDELKYAAFPIYAVTCLPVTFFAIMQFPLYLDLIWATFKNVPQRSFAAVA